MRLKRIWGRERKEEVFIIKIVLGSRIFLLDVARMLDFSGLLGDWRGLVRGKKGRGSEAGIY